jgi:hypothetical protein
VIAISCAVRNTQLNIACGPFLISYLYKGQKMNHKDVQLVQSVIFKTFANEEIRKKVINSLGSFNIITVVYQQARVLMKLK